MAAVIHKNEEVPEFNATNVIEKAQGFAEWLDSRRNLFVAQDLDLSNLNLFTIPECLCNLDSLSVVGLNLSNNLLQFLPDAISNRPRLLTKLDVSNNLLLALPDSIGDLPKLRYLDVRDNQLSSIPDIMGNTLNVLYIDANCLHVLRASTILDQMHHLSRIIVKQQTNKQVVYSPSELKTFLSLRGTINSRFICDAASFLYDFTRDMALPLALVGIAYVVSQVYKRFAPQEILINFGGFLCHRY